MATRRMTPQEIERVTGHVQERIVGNLTALIAEHGGPDVAAGQIPDDVVRRLGFVDLAAGRARLEEIRHQWLDATPRDPEGANPMTDQTATEKTLADLEAGDPPIDALEAGDATIDSLETRAGPATDPKVRP